MWSLILGIEFGMLLVVLAMLSDPGVTAAYNSNNRSLNRGRGYPGTMTSPITTTTTTNHNGRATTETQDMHLKRQGAMSSSTSLPRILNQQRVHLAPLQRKGALTSSSLHLQVLNDPWGLQAVAQQSLVLGFAAFCFAQSTNRANGMENVNTKQEIDRFKKSFYSEMDDLQRSGQQIDQQLTLLERWKSEAAMRGVVPSTTKTESESNVVTPSDRQRPDALSRDNKLPSPSQPYYFMSPALTEQSNDNVSLTRPGSSWNNQNDRFVKSKEDSIDMPWTDPVPYDMGGGSLYESTVSKSYPAVNPLSRETTKSSSPKKNYSMTAWSPKREWRMNDSTVSNVSNSATSPVTAPSVASAMSSSSSSTSDQWKSDSSSSTDVPVPLSKDDETSQSIKTSYLSSISNYVSSLSDAQAPAMQLSANISARKKDYSMTSWSPRDSQVSGSMENSYLSSMPPTKVTASNVPIPPPETPVLARETLKKKYSMTSWSPKDSKKNLPKDTSYLNNISSPTFSPVIAAQAPSTIATNSATYSDETTNTRRSEENGIKKSYAMTKWSPLSTSVIPTSTSNIPDMERWSQTVPSLSPVSSTWQSPATSTSPKKSYSMSKWSPGSNVNNAAVTGSSSKAYLSSMVSSSSEVPVNRYDSSTQSDTTAFPSAASPASTYPFAKGISSSLAPPLESTRTTPISKLDSKTSDGLKKSYAMSKWSPDTKVKNLGLTAGTSSYLASMSTVDTRVDAYIVAPAPFVSTPAPTPTATDFPSVEPPSDIEFTSRSLYTSNTSVAPIQDTSINYIATLSAGVSTGKSKKSFAMTNWRRTSRVNNAATAGSSTSYLANMNLTRPKTMPSYPSITPSAPTIAPQSSLSQKIAPPSRVDSDIAYAQIPMETDFFTEITANEPKKSYSMSKWNPKSQVLKTGLTGVAGSYLSTVSIKDDIFCVPDVSTLEGMDSSQLQSIRTDFSPSINGSTKCNKETQRLSETGQHNIEGDQVEVTDHSSSNAYHEVTESRTPLKQNFTPFGRKLFAKS